MRRTVTLVTILTLVVAFSASAQPRHRGPEMQMDEMQSAVEQMAKRNADVPLGDVRIGDALSVLGRMSIIRQQSEHIQKSAMASFLIPGAGQAMNDEKGTGLLFAAGELAISAGTLAGSYFLLPESVQFGQLNYFSDSYGTIEQSWKALSFMDVLPALGVMTAGSIIDSFYRGFAAKSAGRLAAEKIRTGEITFTPRPFMMMGPNGMPMMGMHYRY